MNLLKQGRVASGRVNGGTASLGMQYFEERRFHEWRYIESQCVTNDSSYEIQFKYEDNNYLKVVGSDLVFDVAFWQMKEGTAVNFVGAGAGHVRTKQGGGGRDWTLNNDGTISAKHHPHLVLGFSSTVDIQKQENKQHAKSYVSLYSQIINRDYDGNNLNSSTDNQQFFNGYVWRQYSNIDMCGKGDVEIIHNWSNHHSIEDLKRMCEERGYSAISLSPNNISFNFAALKKFDYNLKKSNCHSSGGYQNTLYILDRPERKDKSNGCSC